MARRRVRVRVTRRVEVRTRARRTVTSTPTYRPSQVSASRPTRQPSVTSSSTRRLGSGRSPVQQVGENLREVIGDEPREYDVFISHASADKDGFVRPLAEALRRGGLQVWYDEFTLKVGDSLRRKIDHGIKSARYGIVVLSSAFLSGRRWTEHELDGIVNAYIYNRQVLLPIWYGVSHSDVMDYSPSLADKKALSSAEMTVDDIAQALIAYIRPEQGGE